MKTIVLSLATTLSFSLMLIANSATLASTEKPAVLPPADNLVVEGVPSPPLSLVDDVNRYTEYRTAGLTSWHPTKREMLIETRFADTVQVHSVKFSGGARTQLTFFKDSARGGDFQPTRGDYLVFNKDKGGDEFFQKYTYDVGSKKVTLVSDGKSRNTGGVWSNKGDRYAYASTRRKGEDNDIYVVNPQEPSSDRLLVQLEGGGWEPLDWSADDKTLLLEDEVSVNESHLWLADTESGAKMPLTPVGEKPKVVYSNGQFSRDGKGVYVATDKDSEFKRLAYIDLATKEYTYLTKDIPWDVDNFSLSWDGTKIAALTNEDGLTVAHLFDTTTRKELPALKLPSGQIGGFAWHKNNRDLGFTLESARSPADAYSVDVTTGKVERWTESETGGLNTSDFAEPKLIHWKTFDDRQLSAFMYQPPAKFTGKRPVIINIHGGPEGQFRPRFLGRNNYYMNELGIVSIFPNVRGSDGYGKTFVDLDNGFKREDSYKDIGTLIEWIKQQPNLDADRIMITGGSYGGNMTLACAYLYSAQIRCALDVVGPSNLVTFLEHTQAYRRDLRRVEYGDERDPAMRAFLEKIAPTNHVDEIKKPLYVVQGKNDPRVPASESEQMVKAIRNTGTPVWFLMANDEGHGFGKKRNIDYLFYSTIEFIKSYLLN
jgi:dipeptidyl aminopeptidase/acylaminoacyl peptidase